MQKLYKSYFILFCTIVFSWTVLQSCTFFQGQHYPKQVFVQIADSTEILLNLNGTWKFSRDGIDSTPHEISVPANWHTQTIQGQQIEFSGKAWYSTSFTLPSKTSDKSLQLVFEGIDYEAEVWLNNQYLGKHLGYFAPFAFDIQGIVKYNNEENILRVSVSSPNEHDDDWSLHKRLIKGIFGHHDTRPGGAWSKRGQEQNTGGIWGNVFIKASQNAVLKNIEYETLLGKDSNDVQLLIKAHITSFSTVPTRTKIEWNIAPKNFRQVENSEQSLTKGSITTTLQFGENTVSHIIRIKSPHLWYTFDVGTPYLYTSSTTLFDTTGKKMDERHDNIGLRTISCDTATMQWYLNKHRIFLRGTNYIGTQWLSTMNRSDYDADIRLMKEANINAIRVHAHISEAAFYQACDEAGILVWQDFPLQWGYSDDANFFREATGQVNEMISTLYNHPSIFAWCLQNEPPFDADWMKYKYKDYSPQQNKRLNEVLTKVARRADSTRYVHPFSATREHHWQGWYSGTWRDHATPTKDKLITEFGAQALPERSTLVQIFGENNLFPRSESDWEKWEYHNFQRLETFQNAKVPMGTTTEEFITNTQNYQTKLTELAAESYRKQKYRPVGAIFQFMFVEDWASVNWGIVDYLRKPKPGYYALQRAYLPSTVFTEYDSTKQSINVWVVNDTWKSQPNSIVECKVLDKEKNIVAEKSWNFTMPADTSYLFTSWNITAYLEQKKFNGNYTVIASLRK